MRFSSVIERPQQRNQRAVDDATEKTVSLGFAFSKFFFGVEANADFPAEFLFERVDQADDGFKARLADDEQIDIAAGIVAALGERAIDGGKLDVGGQWL